MNAHIVTLLAAIALAACGSSGETTDTPAVETSAAVDVATTDNDSVDEGQQADDAADAPVDTFAQITGLAAPFDNYGERPTFSWDGVDGAAAYDLWLLNADGTMYWAWSGEETTIPLGGLPALTPEAEGPDVAAGMRWTVSAVDVDGVLLAYGSADVLPG